MTDGETSSRTSVAVYACTYQRNEPLRNLLRALTITAKRAEDVAAVGVVIVDDNPDGCAKHVVDEFDGAFELGIHYRHIGARNISIARNRGLAAAMEIADWVAMTDDDCEPTPEWIAALVDVQRRTGAGAVSGPLELRVPPGSPAWLTEQPFLESGTMRYPDGIAITTAATHNSMISAAFLRSHPEIRFDPDLGTVGGEDMVFFRRAATAGLTIHFSAQAIVEAVEPPSRATLRHQLRVHLWLGNTESVTNRETGAARSGRLFMRGGNSLRRALMRPFIRLARHESPQWRYCLASVMQAFGLLAGAAGIRIRHH
ncbi:MAG TPA: glycosyltransferase [Acidimicrobiales bacterium]|nr:glycosyltransferase [Acidimicrobiales bacterium]